MSSSFSFTGMRSPSGTKFHELSLAEKERKGYNNKIDLINTRIKNLQQKQRELDLRIKTMKYKEQQNQNFRQFKKENNSDLQKHKSKQNLDLKQKQAYVQKCKMHRSESMKNSLIKHHSLKQKQFNESRTEHIFTSTMLSQYNNHQYNVNKCKIAKEKLDRMKNKAEKEKQKAFYNEQLNQFYKHKIEKEKNETSKLKNELQELEKYEEKCMQLLHQTQLCKNQMDKKYSKSFNLFSPINKKNKSFTPSQKAIKH